MQGARVLARRRAGWPALAAAAPARPGPLQLAKPHTLARHSGAEAAAAGSQGGGQLRKAAVPAAAAAAGSKHSPQGLRGPSLSQASGGRCAATLFARPQARRASTSVWSLGLHARPRMSPRSRASSAERDVQSRSSLLPSLAAAAQRKHGPECRTACAAKVLGALQGAMRRTCRSGSGFAGWGEEALPGARRCHSRMAPTRRRPSPASHL